MSPTTSARSASPPPIRWTRLAVTHAETILDGGPPVRGVIVGPAGSGKTSLLRHLRDALLERGHRAEVASPALELDDVPDDVVLLVDDAQLLDADSLELLAARVDRPDAAVILARRPWPDPEPLRRITAALEHAQPAVVLGKVTRKDLLDGAPAREPLSPECADGILALTGGITWLVVEALSIHDGGECATDPEHRAIADAVSEVIAHRLDSVSPRVRAAVDAASTRTADAAPSEGGGGVDEELVRAAHAEGLLRRNGRVVPVVRSTVLASLPIDRLVSAFLAEDGELDGSWLAALPRIRSEKVAAALLREGDAALAVDPSRAAQLYRAADECGADAAATAARIAEALWLQGDLDRAVRTIDGVRFAADHPDRERALDIAAAGWAARGSMDTAHSMYRAGAASVDSLSVAPSVSPSVSPSVAPAGSRSVRASIAAIAAMDPRGLGGCSDEPDGGIPSTLDVALNLVLKGLCGTFSKTGPAALDDLVRASELYTLSGCHTAIPEVPAVIAALAAVGVGELEVAEAVLRAAIEGGHAGPWARDRLLLWSAWVALQRERPHDATTAMQAVRSSPRPLTRRDRLVADAVDIALARRYGDSAATVASWRRARDGILHATFDLFTLLPLAEFVTTAARVGDGARVKSHFDAAIARLEGMGAPPVWSAHVRWAGIQRGILENSPDALVPHARALVSAAPRSRTASRMAQAGRVWTSVLAGTVDADAVEAAALGLGEVGLAWDGARLAGHGAGRTDDRRVISQLLACARQLHPREEVARDGQEPASVTAQRSPEVLSPREREVALLVLQGKTYNEIGASIFISPRTAEHHIARIRRRLGATSRSDLIAKLRLVIEDAAEPEEIQPPRREIA